MKQYYVYLAKCSDGTLYCGYTDDLQKRELAHNEGKGAKYTAGRLPISFVYTESFTIKSDALKREYAIKKLTRIQKQALIKT